MTKAARPDPATDTEHGGPAMRAGAPSTFIRNDDGAIELVPDEQLTDELEQELEDQLEHELADRARDEGKGKTTTPKK